jgi:pimeloyl-ACP methyl ester carboxylesterase
MSRRGFFSLMLLGVLIGQGAADSLRAEPRSELTFREITSFDGVPLNVVESGNPAGSPIVFLHGFSQSYLSFLAQLQDPQLVLRHRLIAVDLRGHGASGKPWLREAYAGHLPWARDVRAVVDALQLAAPVIVGWSFGGFVAMDYVREYGPQSVTALLLTGSHGGLLPRPAGVPPIYAGDLDAAIRNAQQFMRLMSVKPVSAADIARGEFSHVMMPAYVRNAMAGTWTDLGAPFVDYRDNVVRFAHSVQVDAVLFTHFVAINAVLGAILGDDRLLIRRVDNCSVTILEQEPDATLRIVVGGEEADSLIR